MTMAGEITALADYFDSPDDRAAFIRQVLVSITAAVIVLAIAKRTKVI
jgi:hypothetical protein